MSGRIYTGYEAAELLSGAAHGPWAAERKNSRIVMSKANKHIAVATICGDRAVDIANTALIAAAPDLAATVVLLSDDLHRVTMELHAARHLAEEGQRARAKQSLELAEALARIAELEALAAGPRAEVVIGADGQPLRFMHGGQAHHVELDASGRPVRMVDLRAGIAPQNVDANGAPVNAEHGR